MQEISGEDEQEQAPQVYKCLCFQEVYKSKTWLTRYKCIPEKSKGEPSTPLQEALLEREACKICCKEYQHRWMLRHMTAKHTGNDISPILQTIKIRIVTKKISNTHAKEDIH
uniref:Uncharacterized protein H25N7.19 n=1 Tax=Trypanosoma brucei TaxID=5691 RepID=Q8WPS3_9TRYP|nr:hypothetical protein [Trypanosoma brucei]